MKIQWSAYGKLLVACSLCGAAACALPSGGEARRIHDPQTQSAVGLQQGLEAGTTRVRTARQGGTLPERIHTILEESERREDVQVPVTRSASDHSIIGTPLASQQQCVKYLLSVNPHPDIAVSPEELVSYYYEEGGREGIRPDVAFAQALKETGFFRYGGTVTPDQNNYCGLGTTSAEVKGAYFPSSQLGVRAHIQHLLAYASTRRPVEPVVDPRYGLVRSTYGARTLGNWEDLNGRWAVPGYSYGQSIMSMFRAILSE